MLRAIASWFNARRRLVAIVLVGWVVLVVVGSGPPADSETWLTVPDLANALVTTLGLMAVVGIIMVMYLRPSLKSGGRSRKRQSLIGLIVGAVLFVLLVLAFNPADNDGVDDPLEIDVAVTIPTESVEPIDIAPPTAPDFSAIVLVLIGALAVALLWLSRTRAKTSPEAPIAATLEAEVDLAIERATFHLRSEPDPRMAVIAAYASLEDALGRRGFDRAAAETPTEHLARALAALPDVAKPAIRLGQLYEIARFSDHPVTAADRDSAADELQRARATLTVPEAAAR